MPELETGGGNIRSDIRGGLPAGTTLRGYELTSILGKGGFGITYQARDLTLNRDVAIKEYLPTTLAVREGRTTVLPISTDHVEQFDWGRERFLDEARTLARLGRTHAIVRVYDFLEANGTAYMVMALIEGETLLKRLLREKTLTPQVVEGLLFPLLDGLEEVHGIGFLHRDIKPANIMIDDEGRPTLIDFGASRGAIGRTTTMTAVFTLGYAAAEQFSSSNLGPWTDIYGLAATLYHAITGKIPPSSFDRVLNDSYEPLSELQPPGFAPALLAGLDAAMAIRAEDRPQSIAEWRELLKSDPLHQHATRIARRPGRLAQAASKARRARFTIKGPALIGAAAAAFVLLAGGGYLAFMANGPTTGMATLGLSTEQLEQVLAERRRADTFASEKRRLEDEARQKSEADAVTKRQADAQLDQAQQARQKAEQELAQLKADIETRRQGDAGQRNQAVAVAQRADDEAAQTKVEAEVAARREAEDEAARKAAAEAEAKRQADQALAMAEAQRKQAEADALAKAEAEAAARSKASEEAQRRAEAEAATRRQADEAQAKAQAEREKVEAEAKIKADAKAEADKAAATLAKLKAEGEAAERGLRLEQPERQRLQVALTSLGFDTRGSDGVLGPRSREMIAGWQQKEGVPATGFVTAAQRDQLFRSAAPAIARWDEEQKKIEDERKKAEETKVAATIPPPSASAPSPAATMPTITAYDGIYHGTPSISHGGGAGVRVIRIEVKNGKGSGRLIVPGCAEQTFFITISSTGEVTGNGLSMIGGCTQPATSAVQGRVTGRDMQLRAGGNNINLTRSADDTATAAQPAGPFDGAYAAEINTGGGPGVGGLVAITAQVTNSRGVGGIKRAGCDRQSFSFTVSSDGAVSGSGEVNCPLGGAAAGTLGDVLLIGKATDRTLGIRIYSYRGNFNALLTRSGN